jgi:hypothetical protein
MPPGGPHHHPSNLWSAFVPVFGISAGQFEWTRVLPIPGGRRRSKRWEAESKRELTQAENPATRWKAQG